MSRARKVIADKNNTAIVAAKGKSERTEAIIKQTRCEIDMNTSESDEDRLQQRLAKLAGGSVLIKAGGATVTELKETKAPCRGRLVGNSSCVGTTHFASWRGRFSSGNQDERGQA